MVYTPLNANGGVEPLGTSVLFKPRNTSWEQSVEDPRVVYNAGTWWMTYTANGAVARPPLNRHQGIASSTQPLDPGAWVRHCGITSGDDCVPPGLKSGAMLVRDQPPHYMFAYDLRKACPGNPQGVCRHTVITTSPDLIHWTPSNITLLARRPGMWDAGLIEPGPPPLLLASGDYLFFYNGATLPNDRQYHVGWAILDGRDPSRVIQRSVVPVLSWTDRTWMVGNTTADTALCYTPSVVFCNGARPLEAVGTFELFFGGADAVIGTAVVKVDAPALR